MSRDIHPLPQYAFLAWCLVKAQGQLYLFPLGVKVLRLRSSVLEMLHLWVVLSAVQLVGVEENV